MTQDLNLTNNPIQPSALVKRMLIGWSIGLAVILFFVLGVKHPRAEWGNLWMIRPLIITPLAGATGGAVVYFADRLRQQYGWNKVLINTLCGIICFIGLWMGIVLGLVGTLWN